MIITLALKRSPENIKNLPLAAHILFPWALQQNIKQRNKKFAEIFHVNS
jgi:hypothetical protein